MIRRSVEYSITCDKCRELLVYSKDHSLTSYVGHVLTEGNSDHILEVAAQYGWKLKGNDHVCPECESTHILN